MNYESRTVGGFEYRRALPDEISKGEVFFKKHGSSRQGESGDAVHPDIMCNCGNFSFFLHYGPYEISAECTSCHAKEVVYDG